MIVSVLQVTIKSIESVKKKKHYHVHDMIFQIIEYENGLPYLILINASIYILLIYFYETHM